MKTNSMIFEKNFIDDGAIVEFDDLLRKSKKF